MQKVKLSLLLCLAWVCLAGIQAATVSPYKMNFNLNINTTEHDFTIGSSWGHLVDTYDEGYTRYTYHPDGGIGNTGYLEIGSQVMIDWDTFEEHALNDLLVTPALAGKVSIYAKTTRKTSSSAGIRFYKMTYSNGTYVMGDEIIPVTGSVQYETFTRIELPSQPSGTRIGIRGSNVAIDDFEAESADISQQHALTIAKAVWAGGKYTDCDANGNYTVSYNIQVQNSGDLPLDPHATGYDYSVSLVEVTSGRVVGTATIPTALSVGEVSADIHLQGTLNSQTFPTAELCVQENVSLTTASLPAVTPSPYLPAFSLTGAYGTTALRTGNSIEYGTSRHEVSVQLLMRNAGSLPQKITEISTTPGFKASLSAPLEIAGHDSTAVTVTMTTDVTGEKLGHLTVKGDGGVDIVLDLNGYTPSTGQLLYDFEDERIPEGFATNNAWFIDDMPTYIYSINNKLCLRNEKQDGVMLSLPKMQISEGQSLRFDVSKIYDISFVNVYYSADRHNWHLLHHIPSTEMSDRAMSASWTGYYYAFSPFTVSNIPPGEWYIGIEAGCVYLDNIVADCNVVPVQHDVYFDQLKGADNGEVNTAMQVNATLHNITSHDEPEGSYTLSYYLDDECMATASPRQIEAMGTRSVALTVTPHKEGVLKGYWKYTADGCEVTSDTTQILVLEESTLHYTLTDELVPHSYTSNAPMDPYNYNGESEAIYTAEELNLKPGTKISSISWYGNNLGEDAWVNVKLYLQNTSATTIAPDAKGEYHMTGREQMTQVYSGRAMLSKAGTEDQYAKLMTLSFIKPFEYTGGNLRLAFLGSTDTGTRTFFAATKGVQKQNRSITRTNVYADQLATTTIFHDALPVIGIGHHSNLLHVTGTVTDKTTGRPVAGATVTLQSGQVRYTAHTNADGSYTMDVYKTALDYEATVTAEGYTAYTHAVQFNGSDVTLNAALSDIASGIINAQAPFADTPVAVFTTDGRRISNMRQGLNLVRTRNGQVRKVLKR